MILGRLLLSWKRRRRQARVIQLKAPPARIDFK